ncbi:MAG TPA: N-acetylmuramoyl-L-alanine amidase [Chloroflexota bacterium]
MIRSLVRRRGRSYQALGVLAVLAMLIWYLALLASSRTIPAFPIPEPLPAPPVPHVMKVGIQAGHWKTYDVPDELSQLRYAAGAMQSDWDEFIVNLDTARSVVAILRAKGVDAELLPTTIPEGYTADAFIALHGDASQNTKASGFKAVHSEWSTDVERDDVLVGDIVAAYQAASGLREDRASITDDMTEYYAFNYRKYRHSVNANTPTAILEMGFLTNDFDRRLMLSEKDRLAGGIASGILDFLSWYDRRLSVGR